MSKDPPSDEVGSNANGIENTEILYRDRLDDKMEAQIRDVYDAHKIHREPRENAEKGKLENLSLDPLTELGSVPDIDVDRNATRDYTLNNNYERLIAENIKNNVRVSDTSLQPSNKLEDETSKITAYAKLEFDNYTFFVQTLQVILGRDSFDNSFGAMSHTVDVHLSMKKAVSRRHAKIFYNFGTQRFELSILGRNGAFVDDLFVEKGITVPLVDGTKIQIGDISFAFILPSSEPSKSEFNSSTSMHFNPSEAVTLRANIYSSQSPTPKSERTSPRQKLPPNRNLIDLPSKLDSANSGTMKSNPDDAIIDAATQNPGNEGEVDGSTLKGDTTSSDRNIQSKSLEIDISLLDQEISSLAPLIDAHNQDYIKEGEDKKKTTAEDARKKQIFNIPGGPGSQNRRHSPLMGKPATPRMGKPASIQPPVSRIYGRQLNGLNGLTKTQMTDNRLTTTTLTGLNNHYLGSHGSPINLNYNTSYSKPEATPSLPTPCLEVEIETMQSVTIEGPALKSITIGPKIENLPVCLRKIDEPAISPKGPKRRTDIKRNTKSGMSLEEIPEQYRTKPSLSYSAVIISILKDKENDNGLTLNEINEAIREAYPFYRYCPDGWQSSINHNLRLNKTFQKHGKKDNQWKFIIDKSFIRERENVRRRQQEATAMKAKIAALKADEIKQRHRIETQQETSRTMVGKDISFPYSSNLGVPHTNTIQQSHNRASNFQKQKTIAEIASEIKREGVLGSKAPLYFKSQSTLQVNSSGELVKRNDIPASITGTSSLPANIKAQLAANRSHSSSQSVNTKIPNPQRLSSDPSTSKQNPSDDTKIYSKSQEPAIPLHLESLSNKKAPEAPQATSSLPAVPLEKNNKPSSNISSVTTNMSQNTKKSLNYLQKELLAIYKARKLSFNTATTTEIITKALATTIAQVNAIGAKAGCGDDALSFLVDQAPSQVTKILDIALSKSIKEIQGSTGLTSPSLERSAMPQSGSSPFEKQAIFSNGSEYSDLSFKGQTKSASPLSGQSQLQKPQFKTAKPSSASTDFDFSANPLTSSNYLKNPPSFLSNKPARPAFNRPQSTRSPKSPNAPIGSDTVTRENPQDEVRDSECYAPSRKMQKLE